MSYRVNRTQQTQIRKTTGMETYKVYAKPIQNNPANESTYVGKYEGCNKKAAIHKAMNAPENRGIYRLDSFFGICFVWEFMEVA